MSLAAVGTVNRTIISTSADDALSVHIAHIQDERLDGRCPLARFWRVNNLPRQEFFCPRQACALGLKANDLGGGPILFQQRAVWKRLASGAGVRTEPSAGK